MEVNEREGGGVPEPLQGEKSGSVSKGGSMEVAETANQPMRREPGGATRIPRRPSEYRGKMELFREARHGRVELDARRSQTRRNCHQLPCLAFTHSVGSMLGLPGRSDPTVRDASVRFVLSPTFVILVVITMLIPNPLGCHNNANWGSIGTATADPCGGNQHFQRLDVSQSDANNLTSIFDCENGNFDVMWSGSVNMSDTIRIGSGTTVSIYGDYYNELLLGGDDDIASSSVAAGGAEIIAGSPFGSMFSLDGATLNLENMALRHGNVTESTSTTPASLFYGGGGIFALDSEVNVVGCEFEDMYSENWGGAIFANVSRVEIRDTVFRRCRAGETAQAGQAEEPIGAGGAVAVDLGSLLLDGSKIEDCYASKKGGGVQFSRGDMTISDSVFKNNSVGSGNIEDKTEVGEGGDISMNTCTHAFDDDGGNCTVRDSFFSSSRAGKKGGVMQLSRGSTSTGYQIEVNNCTIVDAVAGEAIEDDPQGEGGAVSVSADVTLIVRGTTVTRAFAGKKGGVIVMSSALTDDYEDSVGGITILINSTFQGCYAFETGAVIYLNEDASVYVMGSLNRFEDSEVGDGGGVMYGAGDSKIVIKGGNFMRNYADEEGGVIRSKGKVIISDGIFSENRADSMGGVISIADDGSTLVIEGGVFEENEANDGGVVYVNKKASAVIAGGVYSDNKADNGGVFFVNEDASFSVEGGNFTNNEADFGGFLYKKGKGYANCSGTSIKEHCALNGGAIYALDAAKLSWECDLNENDALTGPAIYAREGSTVALQYMKLENNTASRGSVIFLVDSMLSTFQVEYLDPGSEGISAVQADEDSSYTAEETVFTGFAGEAVIYSRGNLILDDCDFSRSSAEVLVDAADSDGDTYIRNAVLGDVNYASALKAASAAAEVPNVDSIVDPTLYCESDGVSSVCGNDAVCINGDLGVYCSCYSRAISGEEMCVVAQMDKLDLRERNSSGVTFYPDLIEVDFVLSLGANSDEANASSSGGTWTVSSTDSNSVRFSSDLGVIWNASASGGDPSIDWTVFPSNGLLPPGESIFLRLVGEASDSFDGTDNITVTVAALGPSSSHGDGESSMASPAVSVATAASAATTQASSSSNPTLHVVTAVTNITFYHCPSSSFWDDAECVPCQEAEKDVGKLEGLDCSSSGASRLRLPIRRGHWRATNTSLTIHECLNRDACRGGKEVEDPDGYCNEGYEGPLCAVCWSDYGRGVANSCHHCTESFKGGMYFVLVFGGLITVLVGIILAIYLVGGARAVSSTLNSTRESVVSLRKRSSEYMGTSVSVTAHAGMDASTGHKSPISTQHPIRRSIITDSGADGGTGEDGEFSPSKLRSRGYFGRAPGLYGQWRRTAKVGGATSGTGVIDFSDGEGGGLDISESRGKGGSPMKKRKLGMKKSKSGEDWEIFNADEHKGSRYSRPMGADARDAGSRTLSPDRLKVANGRGADTGDVKVDLEMDAHGVAPFTMPQSLSPHLLIGSERRRWMEGIRYPPPPSVSLGGREDSDVSQSNWRGNRHWSHGDGMGGASALALRGEEKLAEDRKNPFHDAKPPNDAERYNGIDACRDMQKECDKPVVQDSSTKTCTVGGSVIMGAGRAAAPGGSPPGGKESPATKKPGTSVTNGGGPKEKKTMTARIGAILSMLPLSKLKIIIVVWQILSAFSDITKVPFPPVYERFLETIGIVTFDLGWIFSASCLTTRINFYHKLLMVTLGPVVLLCLLGITFFLGSRGGGAEHLKRCHPNGDASEVPRIPRGPERSPINQGGAVETSSTAQGHGGPRADAGEYGVMQDLRPALASDANGDGKKDAESAPIPAPLIGGVGQPQRSLRAILRISPGAGNLGQNHLWKLFARHTTMTLIILYLVYSQVSTVIFQTFSCADLPEIDKSYLWADFRIECHTRTHKAYEVYASVMIIIYPFGIPAAFWYFLNRQRTRINPKIKKGQGDCDSVANMEKKMKKRIKDASVAPTSFLWAAYVPHRYFFEVFECMRRLLLTGLLVFMIPDSPEQIAISCIFSFLSLMVFELLRPHADDLDLQLYRTGCLVIFFSNFLALMIKAEVANPEDSSSEVFAVILVIVNIVFFLSIFWNAYLSAKVIVSPSHMQGNILGVDLVREDKLDTILPTTNTSQAEAKQGSRRFLFGWKRKKSEAVSSIPEDGEELPEWERREGGKTSQVPPVWRKDGTGSSATEVPPLGSKEARTSTAAQRPPAQETKGTTAVTLGAPVPQGSSVPSEGSTDNWRTSNTPVGAAETLVDAASSRAVSSALSKMRDVNRRSMGKIKGSTGSNDLAMGFSSSTLASGRSDPEKLASKTSMFSSATSGGTGLGVQLPSADIISADSDRASS